jgi:succinyl-diaminopimelate desuccinylase
LQGALELAQELIRRRSVTPEDAGCQEFIAARLAAAGFNCEPMRFGEVRNLWARRGSARPLLCFAGHTDVVPTGPLTEWLSDPFTPTIREGRLYGRGAADMKSSIAAFVVAARRSWKRARRTSRLLTSDEEGPSVDGTVKVVELLKKRGESIDFCIIGEPSSAAALGDMVRVGRRGSLSARLTVRGVQGHVAYPEQVRNPIHLLAPALAEIAAQLGRRERVLPADEFSSLQPERRYRSRKRGAGSAGLRNFVSPLPVRVRSRSDSRAY